MCPITLLLVVEIIRATLGICLGAVVIVALLDEDNVLLFKLPQRLRESLGHVVVNHAQENFVSLGLVIPPNEHIIHQFILEGVVLSGVCAAHHHTSKIIMAYLQPHYNLFV